jgi:hypothetical protein
MRLAWRAADTASRRRLTTVPVARQFDEHEPVSLKGKLMHQYFTILALAGSAFLAGATFAADGMSRDAYKAEKDRIEEAAKGDKKSCQAMKDNAKDICEAEAKAKEKIAKAELDAKNKPSAKADEKVRLMTAEGSYEVAKEKCEDQKGKEMAACKKTAKASYDKAKADIKATAKADAKAGTQKKS